MRSIYKTVAIILVLCLFAGAGVAYAKQISSLPQNQKLIDSYALTMEKIRKFDEVSDLLEAAYPEKKGDDDATDSEQPLEKQWLDVEKQDTKGIFRKAGMSARDFVLTVTTIMQTTIDVELKEKPRSATNAANVELIKKNRAEIEAIMK